MRVLGREYKTPIEKMTLTFNWTRELGSSATVSTITYNLHGLTNDNSSTTSPYTSVRVAGGTPGTIYAVEATMTASDGEISEACIEVAVE